MRFFESHKRNFEHPGFSNGHSGWRPHQESNPDPVVRSHVLYPLSYEGSSTHPVAQGKQLNVDSIYYLWLSVKISHLVILDLK